MGNGMKQWTQGTQKEDQLALIANILSEHGERQKQFYRDQRQ